MKRFACIALLAGFAFAVPAHAATTTVNVTLKVMIAQDTTDAYATCPVPVPQGSNGVVMLDAAVRTGCISSYDTVKDPTYGDFLLSIDQIRGAHEAEDATYWSTTLNGAYTETGIDGFQAQNGQVYGFTYTTWLTCLTPVGC